MSLRSITTEVLKVLNATEELLQEAEGDDNSRHSPTFLPPNTDLNKLDQQFSRLEENVRLVSSQSSHFVTQYTSLFLSLGFHFSFISSHNTLTHMKY